MFQRSAGVLLSLIMLGSCAAAAAVSSPPRPSDFQEGLPSDAPSISGVITLIGDDRRIRVEENPSDEGSAKAIVRITAETQIRDREGRTVAQSTLAVGMRVRIWFTGPVAESFPVQATARVLVIDRSP